MFKNLKNYDNHENNIFHEVSSINQTIKLIKEEGVYELYINNSLQWSSEDEFIYHESLVIPYLNYLSKTRNQLKILVLGGGDGFVVREIMKFDKFILKVDLVDFDAEMLDLHKNNEIINRLNNKSLEYEKLNIIIDDANIFCMDKDLSQYDLIISDLVDPSQSYDYTELYGLDFFKKIQSKISDDSILIGQIGCSIYQKGYLAQVKENIDKIFINYRYISLPMPSFGYYNFVLYSKNIRYKKIFKTKIEINDLKFIKNNMKALWHLKDIDFGD